jgi:hypothetical protein
MHRDSGIVGTTQKRVLNAGRVGPRSGSRARVKDGFMHYGTNNGDESLGGQS